MSLRPDDRSGRSGKSPSRSRDRSRSREPPTKSKSSTSKPAMSKSTSSRSARFVVEDEEEEPSTKPSTRQARFRDNLDEDDEDDNDEADNKDRRDDKRRSMPGGFEPEESKPRYSTREPPAKAPSLSSAGSYLHREDESESDDEETARRQYKSQGESNRRSNRKYDEDYRAPKNTKPRHSDDDEENHRHRPSANRHTSDIDARKSSNGVRPPREADMPIMPGFDSGYFGPPKTVRTHPEPLQTNHRQSSFSSVPYPMDMTMPGSPEDYSSPHAMMPAFPDFDTTRSYHASDKTSYIPQPQSPPRHTDKYKSASEHDPEHSPPRRSSTYPYTAQTREAKPSEHRNSTSARSHNVNSRDARSGSKSLGGDLAPSMGRLSVSGNRPDVQGVGSGGLPPPSPLLEAYRGTYQTASPMPSPLMLPQSRDIDDDIVDTLPPLSPESTHEPESKSKGKIDAKGKRRVVLYDAEGDAGKLLKALDHREARPEPLISILPELTHDQLLHLRQEYKKLVKIGGRGVNLSKQVKSATTGNFGKIAYVTSLGRWESESYWANFWYQSHSSNRELLIEALMGRPNSEMREIKDSFRDKRYDDDMSMCMEKELKADKFRTAVLGALEGKRQEETDTYSPEHRNRDAETLYRALKQSSGGETAILEVVIKRSDTHLREVLKIYERTYQGNFARDALKKSNNLVGEVIAHILNGVINRPARDSLLIRHAIADIAEKNKGVEFRYELLMSRLVRLHWDQKHLARVKEQYKEKYNVDLEREVKDATKGDFGKFCCRLLET
ncbi:MAG: hypothetical protein M1828_005605 [Chrysothrix sp. TS-e1954]|nr:MAG: hypothetical protein M1828_005605 [Chrysothrix sp. TS-e1954]